uniref:PDZ domain-containing protein n=1 Tax=Alexandrium catenella TaxID=2925 RepID=A0A7S1WFU5_ALECA
MFCCCAASEEGANNYSTIAVDEGDPGLQVEPSKFDASSPARKATPLARSFAITVERKKPKAALGVVLDPSGIEAVYVCSVQPGSHPVNEANERSADQLMPGDFIFGVNGVTSDLAAMMQEVQSATTLTLSVRRPQEFSISLCRNGQSVGCAITYDATTGISLVIEAINGGPVNSWNEQNPSKQVLVGDRITAVNGFQGPAVQLLEQIRSNDELRLTFVRPGPA